jgi:hypothetical protein
MLSPGGLGEYNPLIKDDDAEWEEKDQMSKNVQDPPHPWRETKINNVNAHMCLVQQGIGGYQHEMGAVDVRRDLKGPYVGSIKDSSRYDFVGHDGCKGNNDPNAYPPTPFADLIYAIQECFELHRVTLSSFRVVLVTN